MRVKMCQYYVLYANSHLRKQEKKNNKEKGKRACYILPPPDGDQLPPCVILKRSVWTHSSELATRRLNPESINRASRALSIRLKSLHGADTLTNLRAAEF